MLKVLIGPVVSREERANKEAMMGQAGNQESLWSIVLAGGEGERLRPFVQRWLGQNKPKQYCTFIGTRSMLQHTLDRADQVAAAERKVTVVNKSQWDHARPQLAGRTVGRVILQPTNRDTAAGTYLALSHVRAHAPEATVVLYPSDHFIYPEDRFVEVVRTMARAAHQLKDWLFLLGVPPDRVEPDYGWIQPGPHLGWIGEHRVRAVQAFLEKPSVERCKMALKSGAVWNTLILAARVQTLWDLGWHCFPEMMALFERYQKAVGTSKEEAVLESVYQVMPALNLSSHLLKSITKQTVVVELNGVIWNDWGRPERIAATLRRIGKEPAFPQECLVIAQASPQPH